MHGNIGVSGNVEWRERKEEVGGKARKLGRSVNRMIELESHMRMIGKNLLDPNKQQLALIGVRGQHSRNMVIFTKSGRSMMVGEWGIVEQRQQQQQ